MAQGQCGKLGDRSSQSDQHKSVECAQAKCLVKWCHRQLARHCNRCTWIPVEAFHRIDSVQRHASQTGTWEALPVLTRHLNSLG